MKQAKQKGHISCSRNTAPEGAIKHATYKHSTMHYEKEEEEEEKKKKTWESYPIAS